MTPLVASLARPVRSVRAAGRRDPQQRRDFAAGHPVSDTRAVTLVVTSLRPVEVLPGTGHLSAAGVDESEHDPVESAAPLMVGDRLPDSPLGLIRPTEAEV